jgi:hypothetical protein
MFGFFYLLKIKIVSYEDQKIREKSLPFLFLFSARRVPLWGKKKMKGSYFDCFSKRKL